MRSASRPPSSGTLRVALSTAGRQSPLGSQTGVRGVGQSMSTTVSRRLRRRTGSRMEVAGDVLHLTVFDLGHAAKGSRDPVAGVEVRVLDSKAAACADLVDTPRPDEVTLNVREARVVDCVHDRVD